MQSYRKAKIGLIGGGNIGGTLAYLIGTKNIGDVIILDKNTSFVQGKSLDLSQSLISNNGNINFIGTDDYAKLRGCDALIVTAGSPRLSGMTRNDLLYINISVIKSIGEKIKKYCPNAFVIVITNPLDVMVYCMQKYSGLPNEKVVGMAGTLDSGRFKFFLSEALKISSKDISSFVLGGHGNNMVPLINYTSISGIPLRDMIDMGMISLSEVEKIIDRTRNGGSEILKLLQKGSAFYAPAMFAIDILESYLYNDCRILSCAAYLNGEYGESNVYISVPTIIGNNGVKRILELPLSKKEREMLGHSIDDIKKIINNLDI